MKILQISDQFVLWEKCKFSSGDACIADRTHIYHTQPTTLPTIFTIPNMPIIYSPYPPYLPSHHNYHIHPANTIKFAQPYNPYYS